MCYWIVSRDRVHQSNLGLYSVTAIILLDASGSCILSKYYEPLHPSAAASGGSVADAARKAATAGQVNVPGSGVSSASSTQAMLQGSPNPFRTTKDQRQFEKGLWEKTRKANGACCEQYWPCGAHSVR